MDLDEDPPEFERIDWIAQGLIESGEQVPPELRQRILDLGEGAVDTLLGLLLDEDLQPAEGPGEGWVPIHAAVLLGELRAPAAVEPLLDVLAGSDWSDILGARAITALRKMGALALEPALARCAATDAPIMRQMITSVLSGLGVRDERIFTLLLGEIDRDPVGTAIDFAEYGDPRALPHLSRIFDTLEIKESNSPLADQDLVELRAAIERLGGTLTPGQEAKVSHAIETRRRLRAKFDAGRARLVPHVAPKKPGRNEPCPCGSGKKYKKCCLQKDEEAACGGGEPSEGLG